MGDMFSKETFDANVERIVRVGGGQFSDEFLNVHVPAIAAHLANDGEWAWEHVGSFTEVAEKLFEINKTNCADLYPTPLKKIRWRTTDYNKVGWRIMESMDVIDYYTHLCIFEQPQVGPIVSYTRCRKRGRRDETQTFEKPSHVAWVSWRLLNAFLGGLLTLEDGAVRIDNPILARMYLSFWGGVIG